VCDIRGEKNRDHRKRNRDQEEKTCSGIDPGNVVDDPYGTLYIVQCATGAKRRKGEMDDAIDFPGPSGLRWCRKEESALGRQPLLRAVLNGV